MYESFVGTYISVLLDNEQKYNATNSNLCLANCCPATNMPLIPKEGPVKLRKNKTQ